MSAPGTREPRRGERAPAACARCGGAGWILREEGGQRFAAECDCRRAQARERRMREAGIPERYRDCSFRDFNELNPSLARAKHIAEEFADAFPFVEGASGLLFMGTAGLGKTHLAIAILNDVTRAKGHTGLYVDFSDLLMKIQSTFRSDSAETKEDVLEPYATADLLVLDELGATKPTDFARDMLYALLNRRYNDRKITVCTTNYFDRAPKGERESLEDRIGYRLRSRLHEMCRTVEMQGDDHRVKIKNAGFLPMRRA